MIEPVASGDLLWAALAGAAVILFGGGYALLFALARLRRRRALFLACGLCYIGLAIATLVLANVLNLSGAWASIVVVMLIGYLVAPHGIWWLCIGTHTHDSGLLKGDGHG